MNGPMYTQDQFLVRQGTRRRSGAAGPTTIIASQVPTPGGSICAFNNCQSADISPAVPNVSPQVPLPSDNSNLLSDATAHGRVQGTTTLTVSVDSSGVPGRTAGTAVIIIIVHADLELDLTTEAHHLRDERVRLHSTLHPDERAAIRIPYAGTVAGAYYGAVRRHLRVRVVQHAADDRGGQRRHRHRQPANSTDTDPHGPRRHGSATLGLVANQYVRVKHDCTAHRQSAERDHRRRHPHARTTRSSSTTTTAAAVEAGAVDGPRRDRSVLPGHRRHGRASAGPAI